MQQLHAHGTSAKVRNALTAVQRLDLGAAANRARAADGLSDAEIAEGMRDYRVILASLILNPAASVGPTNTADAICHAHIESAQFDGDMDSLGIAMIHQPSVPGGQITDLIVQDGAIVRGGQPSPCAVMRTDCHADAFDAIMFNFQGELLAA